MMHGPDQHTNSRTNTSPDIAAARAFINAWFGHTTEPAYFCSLANDRADGSEPGERHVSTRDLAEVEKFVTKWDRPGRGLYFCVSTIRENMKRNKEGVAEIAGLHADVDFKDIDDDEATVLRRVKALPWPPSTINRSGNGLHLYWRFKEPLIVNLVDGVDTVDRIEAALKLLADLVGGDMKVTQVSALMRLPGTHNSKRGDWTLVEIESNRDAAFELDDIEQMISEVSPVVLRKVRPAQARDADSNPFLEAAKKLGYKLPIDVDARLAAMTYMGGETAAIHHTQVSVSASMLTAGKSINEVVAVVKAATEAAAGDYGKRWHWGREEKAIRGMCETWLKKHPQPKREEEATPEPEPDQAEQHEQDQTEQAGQKNGTDGETVIDFKEKQKKKQQQQQQAKADAKAKTQKVIDRANMHIAIGESVLKALSDKGEPIMVVGDQLWQYIAGLWIEPDNRGRHDLDVLIETCARGMSMTSTLKLVAEVRGWIFRNPDIYKRSMVWDDHGKIAVADGLIDIKTLAFEPAKPSHHVTARINCVHDGNAQCPVWLAMIDSTFGDKGDQERAATIAVIQEVLGMALIEEKSKALSRALVLYGDSNTGKTDLIKTISGLLTDRPISAPLGALDGTHGLMEFHRKAPWVLHEAFKSGVWHFSDMVKSILSGDPVQINIKNGAVVTQRIRQPIFWGSNYAPQFKEATRAIINRMTVIKTVVVFDPKAPIGVAITAREAGHSEPSDLILATEKPGLLNWALAGLHRALDRGRFEPTAAMEETLEAIRMDGNIVAAFLDECVDLGSNFMISTADLCAALKAHYEENKEGKPPSNDSIGRALVAFGDHRIGVDRKALRDNRRGYYIGLHLNDTGSDYWSSAVGDGLAHGKMRGTTSSRLDDVNRVIPAAWDQKAVVLRMRKHFDSLYPKPDLKF